MCWVACYCMHFGFPCSLLLRQSPVLNFLAISVLRWFFDILGTYNISLIFPGPRVNEQELSSEHYSLSVVFQYNGERGEHGYGGQEATMLQHFSFDSCNLPSLLPSSGRPFCDWRAACGARPSIKPKFPLSFLCRCAVGVLEKNRRQKSFLSPSILASPSRVPSILTLVET